MSLRKGIHMAHKVFISYHHALDQSYRNDFEKTFTEDKRVFISKSVQIGDIDTNLSDQTIAQRIRDEYLADSTVTIVLIGTGTKGRKHVDWEIDSSLRDTKNSSRSGLLGILLPTHPDFGSGKYYPDNLPSRLADNTACGYAKIYDYSTSATSIVSWVEKAFQARAEIKPDLSRPRLLRDLS